MLEGLLDELLASKPGCQVQQWISGLDVADQQRMAELLAHPDLSTAEIVRALAPHQKFAETTMRRHRNHINGTEQLTSCGCR